MELNLFEMLLVAHLLKNFWIFCGIRRSITVFTRALHWTLSWGTWIQSSTLHSISLKIHFNIILLPTLSLPSGLFPSTFSTKTLNAFLFSPMYATWPAYIILLDFIILIILVKECKVRNMSVCSVLQSPITLSNICPHILLNTQFPRRHLNSFTCIGVQLVR